jgi:hypothetical protein
VFIKCRTLEGAEWPDEREEMMIGFNYTVSSGKVYEMW